MGGLHRSLIPDEGAGFLYSLGFLLLVTVAGSLLGRTSYHLLTTTGLRKSLPPLVALEIPPVLGGFVFPLLLIRFVYGKSLPDFGVRWFEPGRPFLGWLVGSSAVALVVWVVVWTVLFAVLVFRPRKAGRSPMTPAKLAEANPLKWVLDGRGTTHNLVFVLHSFLFVGFAEELFGRGLLMNALERSYPGDLRILTVTVQRATLLAAILFAAWHIEWIPITERGTFGAFRLVSVIKSAVTCMTIVLLASFAICLVYEKTRSLATAVALHNVVDGGKLLTWYLLGRFFVRDPRAA
jgi:membrane protease YdiL (CAAX protease family)